MLNSKVGYSKNKDAYEAGKETATIIAIIPITAIISTSVKPRFIVIT